MSESRRLRFGSSSQLQLRHTFTQVYRARGWGVPMTFGYYSVGARTKNYTIIISLQ